MESVSTHLTSTTRSPLIYLRLPESWPDSAMQLLFNTGCLTTVPPGPFGGHLFGDKDHGELAPLAILSFTIYCPKWKLKAGLISLLVQSVHLWL